MATASPASRYRKSYPLVTEGEPNREDLGDLVWRFVDLLIARGRWEEVDRGDYIEVRRKEVPADDS